jgi:PhnB protein
MSPDAEPRIPPVVPMPTYEDCGKASEWLCHAFGFVERRRFCDADGRVTTTILEVPGGGTIMPGWTGPDYQSPAHHRQHCETAKRWHTVPYIMDGVLVTVADVNEHCARARAAGAVVLSEPEDTGHGRSYRVEDLEGHRWMFSE